MIANRLLSVAEIAAANFADDSVRIDLMKCVYTRIVMLTSAWPNNALTSAGGVPLIR